MEAVHSLEGLRVESTNKGLDKGEGEVHGTDSKTKSSAAVTVFDAPVAAYLDVETLPDVPDVPRVCCKVGSSVAIILLVLLLMLLLCVTGSWPKRCARLTESQLSRAIPFAPFT